MVVQKLAPELTFEHTDDFSDGAAQGFAPNGSWQVDGAQFQGTPLAGEDATVAVFDLSVGPNSILELEGTLSSDSLGGFFFDLYGDGSHKFAGVLADTNQVVIAHFNKQGTLKYDAVADLAFTLGPEFDLRVSLKGATVSVAVDGQEVLGHAFNAVVVDGAFGVLTRGGNSSFDSVTLATDDPAFAAAAESAIAARLAPQDLVSDTAHGGAMETAAVPAELAAEEPEQQLHQVLQVSVQSYGYVLGARGRYGLSGNVWDRPILSDRQDPDDDVRIAPEVSDYLSWNLSNFPIAGWRHPRYNEAILLLH